MQPENNRLISLDFFRGITVAAMILVNNPGSWAQMYAPLKHAEWDGCTPTDLIFPFFLFIVGVSISFALSGKKKDPASHKQAIYKIIKRSSILFGLGLFLSLYPKVFTDPIEAFKYVRIPGVLQRISVVFLVSAILFLKFSTKSLFRIMIGLLLLYWGLMTLVPVPEVGYANLEKETNLGAWLDRLILTENHLWKSAKTWDPEGLLSTVPAISTGLFGILVGLYIRKKEIEISERIAWLFTAGVIATVIGLIWDLAFPINKSLWTSSFVMYTGGLATICFALLYWIIDVKGYNKYTKPAVVYGVNAITVFFISGLLPRTINLIKLENADGKEIGAANYFYQTAFVPYLDTINASLAWAIMWIVFWLGILWVMYNKKIFIKV